jgi:isochorismate hydrolase
MALFREIQSYFEQYLQPSKEQTTVHSSQNLKRIKKKCQEKNIWKIGIIIQIHPKSNLRLRQKFFRSSKKQQKPVKRL